MEFPDPLIPGQLAQRYKRFLSDIEITGNDGAPVEITAHCPNPGAMLGLKEPGSDVWVSPARNPDRKLKYTWEIIRVGAHHVGINTSLPNTLVDEAIEAGRIAELTGYGNRRREVRYGENSRIDLLLEEPGRPDCYVEVKNVHLKRDETDGTGAAEFPDSVTKRGAKHLRELANAVEAGARAVMIYVVQRSDCDQFRLADDIDPDYAAAFADARHRGVEAICYACDVSPERIEITRPLPIIV
ncbi:MAG: DNA/RNA nuclease SfsA [Rhodospirillaceae bacterium]|jgi:sugar fermentation stimulation protein A|nr:DNA/RNA nuclease SfsA [Rhodospirillaceae bacterium]MBT6403008.1 DNA/RNA nuclease SfsA [Rhodospirillaceae bacterium]MBT6534796.1 DNA/RNA nuclease SfsA [Rhodospirillaceae bacterium]MBT7361664.1 DNA/RNA nuclease SfsA [Rhodospirillaceae bacterium]